jgi:hypothetical protein
MNKQQSSLLGTARDVQAFLDRHADLIGPNVKSARRNFDDAVSQLEILSAQQASSTIARKGFTRRLRSVRAFLRTGHMSAIRQVARMALPDIPDTQPLAVPTRNLSDPRLVAAAQGMADAAGRYATVFAQHGLPADFIVRLRAAADAVTEVRAAQSQQATELSAATASLRAQESRVRKLLKLLNALLVPRLGTDAGLLTDGGRPARSSTSLRSLPCRRASPTPPQPGLPRLTPVRHWWTTSVRRPSSTVCSTSLMQSREEPPFGAALRVSLGCRMLVSA